MALSKCHTDSKNLFVRGLQRMGGAVGGAILNSMKTVAALVKAYFVSQVAILKPITQLNKVFIENFIKFPLSAASATATNIRSTLRAPFFELGVGRKCPDEKKMHKELEGGEKRTTAVSRKMTNFDKQAQRVNDEDEERDNNMEAGQAVADSWIDTEVA